MGGGVTQTERGEAGAGSGSGCISEGQAYSMGAFRPTCMGRNWASARCRGSGLCGGV